MNRLPLLVSGLIVVIFGGPDWSAAQDRRDALKTPGLVVDHGAPTAETTRLLFTRDGKQLLAAGLNKVVRSWPVNADGTLNRDELKTFRWAAFREHRGVIYDCALSQDEKWLAVAGRGLVNGGIAVLNRETGEVARGLTEPTQGNAVTRLAIAQDGNSVIYGTYDGEVRLWSLGEKKNDDRSLGSHGEKSGRIQLLAMLDETTAISVAENGSIRRWELGTGRMTPLAELKIREIDDAALSPDRKMLAVCTADPTARGVHLWTIAGGEPRKIPFGAGTYPRKVAFSAAGDQIVVATELAPQGLQIQLPLRSELHLFQVATGAEIEVELPRSSYAIHSLAFAPQGKFLVTAGGNDHELTVWDLEGKKVADRLSSRGATIWQAAWSTDGKELGIRTERQAAPATFNQWGSGAWRRFDLTNRVWNKAAGAPAFTPSLAIEEADGWSVQPLTRFDWQVFHRPTGKRYPLPIDPNLYDRPHCFTFLPARGKLPTRIAVGHLWGVSLFQLVPNQAPVLARIMIGHEGRVRSVTPAPDFQRLLSSSDDQTVAAWTLDDWPHHAELGASFAADRDNVVVREVAAGSPAWEAGLAPGDVIVRFHYRAKLVAGDAAARVRVLQSAQPGVELFFEQVRRAGEEQPLQMLTTVRQRPLWRFYPANDDEWILWRWRDYFYDCSLRGDDLIGWQTNGHVDETPSFARAEQYRERFHKPEKLNLAAVGSPTDLQRIAEPELVPPRVRLAVTDLGDDQHQVEINVVSPTGELVLEPLEVDLWINDYRHERWIRPKVPFAQTLTLSREQLRSGTNRVQVQAYSQHGLRGDSSSATIQRRGAVKPKLFALAAGVNDYTGTVFDRPDIAPIVFPVKDAEQVHQRMLKQGGGAHYEASHSEVLTNQQVSKAGLLARITQFARQARPDDVFVLFLSGHGWARSVDARVVDPQSFVFVTPQFDLARPFETGLPFSQRIGSQVADDQSLFSKLARLRCRKVLLLDSCHAGGSTYLMRSLSPQGIDGPVMLVSCSPHESSYEIQRKGHGAFTVGLLDALDNRGTSADRNNDAQLIAAELATAVQGRVASLLEFENQLAKGLDQPGNARQTPEYFVPRDHAAYPFFSLRRP